MNDQKTEKGVMNNQTQERSLNEGLKEKKWLSMNE